MLKRVNLGPQQRPLSLSRLTGYLHVILRTRQECLTTIESMEFPTRVRELLLLPRTKHSTSNTLLCFQRVKTSESGIKRRTPKRACCCQGPIVCFSMVLSSHWCGWFWFVCSLASAYALIVTRRNGIATQPIWKRSRTRPDPYEEHQKRHRSNVSNLLAARLRIPAVTGCSAERQNHRQHKQMPLLGTTFQERCVPTRFALCTAGCAGSLGDSRCIPSAKPFHDCELRTHRTSCENHSHE